MDDNTIKFRVPEDSKQEMKEVLGEDLPLIAEDLGIITRKNNGYILNDIQEIELHKLYSPKITISPEVAQKIEKSQYRAKAIETINTMYFQGVMSPSWYTDINLWFEKYQFDEQVMLALFKYCFDHSAMHRNYIQVVANAWCQANVKCYSDLEKYYIKQEKLVNVEKKISKKWKPFLYKVDGSRKKMIMYSIAVSSVIDYKEKAIHKLQRVLDIFKDYKEEICLLWYWDVIMEDVLRLDYSDLWNELQNIVNQYKEENWGIYEEESDKDLMVRVCDAYYGDGSVVSKAMVMAKKPVMLQNYDC